MSFIIQSKNLNGESRKSARKTAKVKQNRWLCKYYNLAFMYCLVDIIALFVVLFSIFFCMNLNSAFFH